MAELIAVLKKALWFSNQKQVVIDSWTFKTYNVVTSTLLITASIVVTAKQFFGYPIRCDAAGANSFTREDVLDSYCWMYATFDIPSTYHGPCAAAASPGSEGPIYNSYYQWVPLYLNLLALFFYFPRIVWNKIEGGLMKFMSKGKASHTIDSPAVKRDELVRFFVESVHCKYRMYVFGFIFCEFLNLLISLAVLPMTDSFLKNRFMLYGINVIEFYHRVARNEVEKTSNTNPMCYTFPRIASCHYYRYGSAGHPSTMNAICILALNIINDKVFLLFWFWDCILIGMGLWRVIFRSLQIMWPRLRYRLLQMRLKRLFKVNPHADTVEAFVMKCNIGDWFILYQLSKNINRRFYMDFLNALARSYDPDLKGDEDLECEFFDMMFKPQIDVDSDDKRRSSRADSMVHSDSRQFRKSHRLDSIISEESTELHTDEDLGWMHHQKVEKSKLKHPKRSSSNRSGKK